jgi:hypothetical protein
MLSPARVAALIDRSRRAGERTLFGAPITGSMADAVMRVMRSLRPLAESSTKAGTLANPAMVYSVFIPSGGRHRLLCRALPTGRFIIDAVERVPVTAQPPSYLGEIDLREIEYDTTVKPMKARVVWHKAPLTKEQIAQKFSDKRVHLVYIPLDDAGRPVKVGESTTITTRLEGYPYTRFFVGRVVDESGRDLMGPFAKDAEKLITRKMKKMGFDLPAHARPKGTIPIKTQSDGQIELKTSVPKKLQEQRLSQLGKTKGPEKNTQLKATKTRKVTIKGDKAYEFGPLLDSPHP